ncbi:hypothetical protein DFJ77DRAFT_438353 [Powellomyces hirtus]|nr:hypothetical protein DFJ77DRAFT_438353 [Powellomyces hirtus]
MLKSLLPSTGPATEPGSSFVHMESQSRLLSHSDKPSLAHHGFSPPDLCVFSSIGDTRDWCKPGPYPYGCVRADRPIKRAEEAQGTGASLLHIGYPAEPKKHKGLVQACFTFDIQRESGSSDQESRRSTRDWCKPASYSIPGVRADRPIKRAEEAGKRSALAKGLVQACLRCNTRRESGSSDQESRRSRKAVSLDQGTGASLPQMQHPA